MTPGHAAAGRQVRSETGLPLPVPAADPHHRHLQVTSHVPRGQECNMVTRVQVGRLLCGAPRPCVCLGPAVRTGERGAVRLRDRRRGELGPGVRA